MDSLTNSSVEDEKEYDPIISNRFVVFNNCGISIFNTVSGELIDELEIKWLKNQITKYCN